ncbi:MAG: Uncharacterised protein [Glaciecola sp. HTCC2999]|jgi:hypothetical protein|nr:MAG: Uncharacterised protein [Glaciecola sp. HTCC2999]
MKKLVIGSLEKCDLPQLGIEELHIRVDTGAKTSSLHVDNIEEFTKDDAMWIAFDIHPDVYDIDEVIRKKAKVVDIKKVKSSTATKQRRYVIHTKITMANKSWTIRLTLTDRSKMTYRMLLGREAMKGRFVVDPECHYRLG